MGAIKLIEITLPTCNINMIAINWINTEIAQFIRICFGIILYFPPIAKSP